MKGDVTQSIDAVKENARGFINFLKLIWNINTTITPRITSQNSPKTFWNTHQYSSFFYYLPRVLTT